MTNQQPKQEMSKELYDSLYAISLQLARIEGKVDVISSQIKAGERNE